MLKRILKDAIAFFNTLCVFLPFGLAVLLAAVYTIGGWEKIFPGHNHTLSYYFLSPVDHKLTAVIMITLTAALFYKIYAVLTAFLKSRAENGRTRRADKFAYCIYIFFVALIVRFLLMYLFNDRLQPFSDFYRTWRMALGDTSFVPHYSIFPAYLNYAVLESWLIRLFGDQYKNLLYMNAFFASLSAVLIYVISKMLFKEERLAVLSAFLYVLMPSNILYCGAGTPEFVAIAFDLAGVLLLQNTLEKNGKSRYLYAVGGGLCLGIGSSYKEFGIVILIAALMVFTAKELLTTPLKLEENGNHKERVLNADSLTVRLLSAFVCVALAFGFYTGVKRLILNHTIDFFSDTLNQNNIVVDEKNIIPHFLMTGLNTMGEGQTHIGPLENIFDDTYYSNGFDAEAAAKVAMEALKNDWMEHPGDIIPNLAKKMIWAWQDDNIPFTYFTRFAQNFAPKNVYYCFLSECMNSIEQLYYLAFMLFALIGCCHYWKEELHWGLEFLLLIIFGYFCVILISEAQSRYKCLILPYICPIAATGIYSAKQKSVEFLRSHFSKH